jgi:hypothetical protein
MRGGLGVGAVAAAAEASDAVRLTIVPPRTATRRLARCLTLSGRTAPRATAPSGRLAAWRWRRRRGAATTRLVQRAPPASVAAPQRQRRKIPMRRRRRRRPPPWAPALACAPPWASLPISRHCWMDGRRRLVSNMGCAGAMLLCRALRNGPGRGLPAGRLRPLLRPLAAGLAAVTRPGTLPSCLNLNASEAPRAAAAAAAVSINVAKDVRALCAQSSTHVRADAKGAQDTATPPRPPPRCDRSRNI